MATQDDDILVQSVDPVPEASGDMTSAQIDDIERRAHATELTLQTENGKGGDAGNETKVAGELAMEAAGGGLLKLGSMALDIVSDRFDAGKTDLSAPTDGKTDGIVSGKAQTMDQMIVRSVRGEELVMGANIAESSLRGQDKESVGTWSVNSAKVDGVQMAKRLTFDKVYANKNALDSVPVARARYDSTMHSALQMAPGMAPRPNMRPSEMVAHAEEHQEEMERWRNRSGEGSWS